MIFFGVAAVRMPSRADRNLKVLPQDISDQKLDSIMKAYNIALGVDCKFCHTPFPNMPDSLNYPLDTNPMKENARNMMRMMIMINKSYFNFYPDQRPEYLNTVHCKTCHRGEPIPPE
ncbi:MAG TPA: c-type cytochrome [Chitinophagaceae bacterium]|nr:c-type cytochrome [Chitinophagaceae bacterium]